MADCILIASCGGAYMVTAHISGYSRTYPADTLEAAQRRAERLCYILDLKPEIIQCIKPRNRNSKKEGRN